MKTYLTLLLIISFAIVFLTATFIRLILMTLTATGIAVPEVGFVELFVITGLIYFFVNTAVTLYDWKES